MFHIYQAIYIVVFIVALICYFHFEVLPNKKHRAINKIIMASLFLIYAWEEYFRLAYPNYGDNLIYLICLAAITFSYIGDVVLLFSFKVGGIFFMVGNFTFSAFLIKYAVYQGLLFVNFWWFLLIYIAFLGTFFILAYTKFFYKMSKHAATYIYMPSVTLHAAISIVLAILIHNPFIILLSIGLTLFMISDFFIMINHYVMEKSKLCLRLNSGFYFIGLLIVSLSISYIAFI